MRSVELRGLSPIVSVVLLILIAVAASVLIYTWMSGLATSSPASEPALQERIKIVAVAKNATSVTVYVQNLGAVPVKVSAVYIIAANGTLLCSNTTPTDNTTISPSTIGEIVVDSNCANVLSIGTYTVKVVTGRGTEAYYTLTIAAS